MVGLLPTYAVEQTEGSVGEPPTLTIPNRNGRNAIISKAGSRTVPDLDDTDRTILRLLVSDARRPYSDIADAVDLSPPAVSDRVQRLREWGVIRRFTADLDRSSLREGTAVLVDLTVGESDVEDARGTLVDEDAVEHVFTTAEGQLVFTLRTLDADVRSFVADRIGADVIRGLDVRLLADESWSPGIGAAEFAPTCAECGNTVTSEGDSRTLGDETYHFCCSSCADRFETQYRELEADA